MTDVQRRDALRAAFGPEKHAAIEIFDDAPRYPIAQVAELARLCRAVEAEADPERWPGMIADFAALRRRIAPIPGAPERVYLWAEGAMPSLTAYTDNSDYRYNHDPDFRPYFLEMLLPGEATPKGAVVVVPGGDQGDCTLTEGYQTCLELGALGYQCFLLHNRVNHNPWSGLECGADVARAIRYIRAHAADYRVRPDQVAFAGFSNGGLTGEACIAHYSGGQRVTDHFPGYVPDALDAYPGAPDAYLCVYGPRLAGAPFDWTGVVYPPSFFAVGREDRALDNLNALLPELIAHGVEMEIHTFAATPHGVAGIRILDPDARYPQFERWPILADAFLQDLYNRG
ncbi:MAG: alpha/beta hydrolase [Christensenellales bacterium]|jgi:acetyl esterase/lipase